jgi:hypothetical protein
VYRPFYAAPVKHGHIGQGRSQDTIEVEQIRRFGRYEDFYLTKRLIIVQDLFY